MARLKVSKPEVHGKIWGHELWIENCHEYCGKLLKFLKSGLGTSTHFHMDKLETMHVHSGVLLVELIDPEDGEPYEFRLTSGQSIQIPRGQSHRLTALEDDTVVFEFSTHHRDDDSFRVGPRLTVS